jgi:hypothetical protein
VTVTTAPPLLQTETAEVNHQITVTQVSQLPIIGSQGRNFQSLYTLIPGASSVSEQNSTASNPSRAQSVNFNGVEYNSNTTRIDGAVNYYGWLPYLVAYVPPADSIQNVNVVTNSFNAEQGVAGGASINVSIKSGTDGFHGSLFEYYQDAALSARPYTATPQSIPVLPKNIFNEWGFSIGGPVYIPKVITGKKKLFFFQDFDRATRRQLISGTETVPTTAMLGGDFSAVANLGTSAQGFSQSTVLYDPQPGGVGPYLPVGSRPTFLSEYGCNCIPASRISTPAGKMLALLQPISAIIGNPTTSEYVAQLANLYNGTGTLAYNNNRSDSKITYIPTENTQIFGRYSFEPFSVTDPQALGAAGGGTFDGGQPGAASGLVQNVGLGASHVISPSMVVDWDFGYTRQRTGAQSQIDLKDGDFGLNYLEIPGTNGVGTNYVGQPVFAFGNLTSSGASSAFSSLGNSNGANPFLFRDNQFTTDVNLSWTKGKHAMKYGFTYYHFDLNHFQPTSGSGINNPRGGFQFQGGLTTGPLDVNPTSGTPNNLTAYNALADFLLGLPNNGTGTAVAKAVQLTNPNSLRWSEYAAYAQDQWMVTSKLTLNYGLRYEMYPSPYRDHTGVYILDPSLPQTGNVVIGGVNGQPENSGLNMGHGFFAPRVGIAYRVNERTVVRTGGGFTSDPDSLRFLRDSFPEDLAPNYNGTTADSIAINPANGQPLTLSVGIPPTPVPDISTGLASLAVSGTTNTTANNYHRGYIESWNLFFEREFTNQLVGNLGYVGTHQVRQLIGYTLDAAPIPNDGTPCGPSGTYNPGSGLTGPCSFQANTLINTNHCNLATGYTCYNTGGITMNQPLLSSEYSGLQAQLTYRGGHQGQGGLIYTWSKAIDFGDNGAGSGSTAFSDSYPAYFGLNRSVAGYDRTNNIQIWGIYDLPFGSGHALANSGIANTIFGGFQLNGQFSHISGTPFSVSPASSTLNAPGNTQYAELVGPYQQLGGHNRTPGNSAVNSGQPWFNPASFGPAPANAFSNTIRNEFRGPGQTLLNASVFRSFHVWRESAFQIRFEAFNALNHPILNNPNTTVGGGTFGYITSFGTTPPAAPRVLQFGGRYNF